MFKRPDLLESLRYYNYYVNLFSYMLVFSLILSFGIGFMTENASHLLSNVVVMIFAIMVVVYVDEQKKVVDAMH